MQHEKLLTEREACQHLNVSRSFLARRRSPSCDASAGPPWVRLGGNVRYRLEDLDAYVAANRQESGQ